MTKDESDLKTLSIFHYVLAGAVALFSSIFLFHFFMGLAFLIAGSRAGQDAMPPAFGLLFMGLGGAAVLVGWSLAGCIVFAGRSLARHKRHTFCVVVGALMCMVCVPFGTALGIFTIIVLVRPAVKALFGLATEVS